MLTRGREKKYIYHITVACKSIRTPDTGVLLAFLREFLSAFCNSFFRILMYILPATYTKNFKEFRFDLSDIEYNLRKLGCPDTFARGN